MTERVFCLCALVFPYSYVLASPGRSKQSLKKAKDGKNNFKFTVRFVNQLIFFGGGGWVAISFIYLLIGEC